MEVREVLRSFDRQRDWRGREQTVIGAGRTYAVLDAMVSEDNLLGSSVFDVSPEIRKGTYHDLPEPGWRMYGENDEECADEDTGQLYVLLWAIEPDEELGKILLERFERSYVDQRSDFWSKKLEPILVNMTDEQKERRRKEIKTLKPPHVTDYDEEQRGFQVETQLQRGEQELRTQIARERLTPRP